MQTPTSTPYQQVRDAFEAAGWQRHESHATDSPITRTELWKSADKQDAMMVRFNVREEVETYLLDQQLALDTTLDRIASRSR